MKHKKKKKEFHDLLLPILLILTLLPFITRLIFYDSGLSSYPWFSDQGMVSDFFSYYKSYGFMILAILCGILLLFYLPLHRGKNKELISFIPLAIYCLLTILSTFFSVHYSYSIVGGIGHFENVIVLIGYAIVILYTYQIDKAEEDYINITKALCIALCIMAIIGLFQAIGKDLLQFPSILKLILPSEYHAKFLNQTKNLLVTNAVSLTLANPNYASVYLSMMIPFLAALMIPAESRKKKLGYLVLIFVLMILLFKTYSRSGLLAIFLTGIVLLYFYRHQLRKIWKQCLGLAFVTLLLFTGIDSFNEFRFTTKIAATFQSFQAERNHTDLEEILTTKDFIKIRYQGKEVCLSLIETDASEYQLSFTDEWGTDITNLYNRSSKTLAVDPFDELEFSIEKNVDSPPLILCNINDITWKFSYHKVLGYQYINGYGKRDSLSPVEKSVFTSCEHIGSGRGYIWSRSIPIMKDTILIGKGPDTFPLVFPQSDYVGKANNCKTPYTLIEKPHSMYLGTAIQTGVLSLFAFLCFYLIYAIHTIKLYRKASFLTFTERFGFGCFLATLSFMINGIFHDSSLQTTPIFCIFIGLGMDINYVLKKIKR
ncbi:MAG: hypothetical protein K0S47_1034 [Herbinix sp.]|nr:hypothetical protein [Herbinix sp.]